MLLGAVAGDIIGSVDEHHPIKEKAFPLFQQGCAFTDDTELTLAVADAIRRADQITPAAREPDRSARGTPAVAGAERDLRPLDRV